MRLGTRPPRDVRELGLGDPRIAALADLTRDDPEEAGESYPLSDEGVDEDSVAMPGNGQMSIDDLETTGMMTPDLMAKARPDVYRMHLIEQLLGRTGTAARRFAGG